ncbi:MAG: phosphatase PAP2 family protein [Candidatus Aenigmarchaeota archaeon]|nr:phosphatase PAP2 family protein [Candidatus Aenigmarchaeota archaeon]
MRRRIYEISGLIDRKPFHLFAVMLAILNLSGIGNPNYLTTLSVAGAIFSSLLSLLIKLAFKTRRPEHNKYRIIKYGFPSGHSHVIFTTATIYSYYVPALTALFFLTAAFVSVSRVTTKAHTHTDVIAGGILGILTGLLMVALGNTFFNPVA